MGIEPTRDRVNDPSTALKADDGKSQGAKAQALTESTASHCTKNCTNEGQERDAGDAPTPMLPDDLATVVTAWNKLPEALRAGIVAMVKATAARTNNNG